MNDSWIGPGARVDRAIIDKQVIVGFGAQVGCAMSGDPRPNLLTPDKLDSGQTVVGKGAFIPTGRASAQTSSSTATALKRTSRPTSW